MNSSRQQAVEAFSTSPDEQVAVRAIAAATHSLLQRDLVAILDEVGNYSYVSPAYFSTLGYQANELVGLNAFSLIHPDDQAHLNEEFQRLLVQKQEISDPYRFRKKDGSYVWLKTIGSNLADDPDVKGYIINSTDVTDIIEAQEALHISEKQYKYLFENSPAPMFVWDFETRKIVDCNEECLLLYGYPKKEFLNLTILDIRPKEELNRILEATSSATMYANRTSSIHRQTWKHLKKTGELMLLEITGHLLDYQGRKSSLVLLRDVTQLKKEEQQRKLLESVVTNSGDAILITEAEPFDEPGPRILYVNEAFCRMTGYDAEEVIGKSPRILQGPKTSSTAIKNFSASLRNWQASQMTVINYAKSGREFWVDISVSPVMDDSGLITHWIAIQRDVTDEKRVEQKNKLKVDLSHRFSKHSRMKDCLGAVLDYLKESTGFEMAECWWSNSDNSNWELFNFDAANINGLIFKNGQELPSSLCFSRKVQLLQLSDNLTVLGLPLLFEEQVFGLLVFANVEYRDITEAVTLLSGMEEFLGTAFKRKKLEEELNQIFFTAQDVMGIAGLDGYLKRINPAACSLLGYTEKELLNIPFQDLIYADDKDFTIDKLMALSEDNSSINLDARLVASDGNLIWLNWSFTLSKEEGLIFAVAKNITEQRALQKLLNNATNLARIGGWEYSIKDHRISLSAIAVEMLQLQRDGMVNNMDWDKLLGSDENHQRIKLLLKETLLTGKKIDEEFLIKTQDGTMRWVRIIGEPDGNSCNCTTIAGSIQDIHQRKTYEASLQKLNKELEQKARELAASNTELEQFAYVASHDLQEPLRMVTSFLTQIEKKYQSVLDDKGKQYIFYAVDGAMRMRQIILDLLDYSRVGRINQAKDRLILNAIIKEVSLLNTTSIAEKSATIIVSDLPVLYWYHTPVLQLFQNLIGNALKYSRQNIPPEIRISVADMGEQLKFTVSDNGIGISSAYFGRIFTIFQRLHSKQQYGGTGMGLAIVKKIIEHWGGEIWVDSEPGCGSSFYFTIPKELLYEPWVS
ncbi:PAS domain-containing sensor histidine kinase [Flavihumibacter sp. UBA7668]|uniref:PAS domain-containing sensor histidine kinase n=1 Tax=Flavihumibacter sp. UBA7668 TaxID=1946542 RepID=UPI0025BC89FC|nr:PAS domain S-box protein [Flavihumibacter sp. UBA7668]